MGKAEPTNSESLGQTELERAEAIRMSLKESNVDLERPIAGIEEQCKLVIAAHSSKDVEVEYSVCIISLS